MGKNLLSQYEEVVFGTSDKKVSKRISNLEKKGRIKKIAPRVYTTNLGDDLTVMHTILKESNAFMEPEEGMLRIV
jgi:DNA-binding Lrp family transcriptional regulator